MARLRRQQTYFLRQDVCSQISESELEASVLTIDKDFDSDQSIRSNWTDTRNWSAHAVGGRGRQ